MSDQTIDELKTAAIDSVDLSNPMFAYHTHLKGRESEYSYAEFLEDIKPPESSSEPTEPTTPVDTYVKGSDHTEED